MEIRTSPLRHLHAAAGAAFAERGGWELPAWYGEADAAPAREYAWAREATGLVDLCERDVLVATGPHRQKFLHSILSNDIERRGPGDGCLAALMNVKGHLIVLLRALVTPEAVILEMPADPVVRVEEMLIRYRVAAPVRFERTPTAVLGLLGPGAGECLAAVRGDLPDLSPEAHASTAIGGRDVRVARATDLPGPGFVLHARREDAGDLWRALVSAGAHPVGRRALDALRVEAGRAWFGFDIGEENLLHETGLLHEYHSATKGCYLGQEVVARLEGRGGHVNKMIRGLEMTRPGESGAAVSADGKDVGSITTAAVSPRLGPVALAYVHRSHFAPGTRVDVGGAPATVVELPFGGP